MTLLEHLDELDLQDDPVWTTACGYDRLVPCRGVGVLLPDGTQVALLRLDDGSLRAVGNIDPFSGAAVTLPIYGTRLTADGDVQVAA
ncbi:MAG: nitrite reductase small subunit [Mycobacterium sp.]|nr:nitrite reductase small subunit [Mycobacterium sp.]